MKRGKTRAEPLPGLSAIAERDPLDFNRTPPGMVLAILPLLGQPRTVLDVPRSEIESEKDEDPGSIVWPYAPTQV